MHDCQVSAGTRRSADLMVQILGGDHPVAGGAVVEAQVARLLAGSIEGPQLVIAQGQSHLLLRPEEKPWLSGGENWRLLGRQICQTLRDQAWRSAVVVGDLTAEAWQALAEGAVLGDYRYLACRERSVAKRTTLALSLRGPKAAIARGVGIATAQNRARELADAPGNRINPRTFAAAARKLLRGSGITVSVTQGLTALAKAGFPGLVQVGQGSQTPPALLTMRYRPSGKTTGKPHLALVGKGLTFDSGGISLKPGPGMWMMKADMSGAAAVLGAMLAIAEERPAVPITAYCALAENMPDAKAQRPGDIYQARNGSWVHVDNTDAEGRLVLADVLTYACEQGATHVVDLATLTGACIIALGHGVAAVMSRHDDWAETVVESGAAVGERFWRLPLPEDYRKQLEHPHADINNIGGKAAGTITAGLFLSHFVPETVRWAHCDIAGTAMQDSEWRYYQKGMVAFGVRSLVELARRLGASGRG